MNRHREGLVQVGGATLLELVVVMAIVSLLTTISVVALSNLRPAAAVSPDHALEEARRRALSSESAVMVLDDSGGAIRFLPDGRVLGSHWNPLTGEIPRESR